MKKIIFKYPLKFTSLPQILQLPRGAEILTAQIQWHGASTPLLCLWALVPAATVPVELRTFEVVGTGMEINDLPRKYLATVFPHEEVYHIFEQLK